MNDEHCTTFAGAIFKSVSADNLRNQRNADHVAN